VDATAVARLRQAGAIVMGKTTTMEFAAGCPDPTKPFPIPRNPWNQDRWAGGSSSGTASGVASGCFLGGVGSDTLGSIRGPAAFCGITGIKPTFGRVSATHSVPLVPSFDHVGPLARTARDCALLLQAMAGHDPQDPHSVAQPVPDFSAALDGDITGLRIGVERAHHLEAPGIDPSAVVVFEDAIRVLEKAGAVVTEVAVSRYDDLKNACIVVALREAFVTQRENLRRSWADYGRETRLLLAAGALFTEADAEHAHRVIERCRREVDLILGDVDLLAMPTMGVGALPLEGLSFLTLMMAPAFTQVWDGLRHPVASVPIGFTDDGMPLGMQLAGRFWDESTVLRAADAYQQHTDWHTRLPPL
jgi:aspartyl-tRNA(Asn)/glutamyl-tRNA(Gln) amidotransferase subunit A